MCGKSHGVGRGTVTYEEPNGGTCVVDVRPWIVTHARAGVQTPAPLPRLNYTITRVVLVVLARGLEREGGIKVRGLFTPSTK